MFTSRILEIPFLLVKPLIVQNEHEGSINILEFSRDIDDMTNAYRKISFYNSECSLFLKI